jgi:hypothetical protein
MAGRLAGEGMLAEEFESCGDGLNDAVGDAGAGALGPVSKDFEQIAPSTTGRRGKASLLGGPGLLAVGSRGSHPRGEKFASFGFN